VGKHTKPKVVRPPFLNMPHPTRQREASCDPGSLETIIPETLTLAARQMRARSADARIDPAEERKAQYRSKHKPRQWYRAQHDRKQRAGQYHHRSVCAGCERVEQSSIPDRLLLNNRAVAVLENKCTSSNGTAPGGLEKGIVDISAAIVKEKVATDIQVE